MKNSRSVYKRRNSILRKMKKLKTEEEIKKYIRRVILQGNRKKIETTLKRYYVWRIKKTEEEQISAAKEVFGIDK